MTRLLLTLLLAIPAAAQITTTEGVRKLLDGPTVGGHYGIAAGVYQPGSLYINRGDLSGTADNPVVITGAGIDQTIIECPNVCYFEPNAHVVFQDLTIRGAWNSRHLRRFTFQRVRFDDPAGIGWKQRVLWKTTGAPTPQRNPVDIGAGPIVFIECEFSPHPDGKDTALDFVATQGVQILDSIWERCNRGCLQAKGGSGIREPFVIARNWIKDGGARGLFLGGGANPEFFDPPIEEARAEFGAAEVYDNIIEGSPDLDVSACLTVGTAAGPVDFHHNLCLGNAGHLFRLVDENQNPATKEGVRNVTIRDSVIAGWRPPMWPNTNVLATSHAKSIRWETITLRDLVFDMPSRKEHWGWPEAQPLPVEGIIENAVVEIERDAAGPRVVGWDGYGPRPVEVDESIERLSLFVGQNGKLYATEESAKRAGEYFRIVVEVER